MGGLRVAVAAMMVLLGCATASGSETPRPCPASTGPGEHPSSHREKHSREIVFKNFVEGGGVRLGGIWCW